MIAQELLQYIAEDSWQEFEVLLDGRIVMHNTPIDALPVSGPEVVLEIRRKHRRRKAKLI
jgi:hypothetical protein